MSLDKLAPRFVLKWRWWPEAVWSCLTVGEDWRGALGNAILPSPCNRGEVNATTTGTQRCLCPDLELNWARCQWQAPTLIHTKPKCLIQPSASTEIFPCRPLHQPYALGNPLMLPSSLQTLLHIKPTCDLEIFCGILAPCAEAVSTVSKNEPFWIVASR